MLPADDVIDLVLTSAVLMYQTVFTAPACAFDDEATRGLIYIKRHWRGSVGPAPSLPEDVLQVHEVIQFGLLLPG